MSNPVLKIYTDGGSRGNPGPSAIGVIAFLDDKKIFEEAKTLGKTTNNQAEYQAVFASLGWLLDNLKDLKIEKIEWFLDSKLVVEQLSLRWKIKDQDLKEVAGRCWQLLAQIPFPHSFTHIPREMNSQADALVNRALDATA